MIYALQLVNKLGYAMLRNLLLVKYSYASGKVVTLTHCDCSAIVEH